MNETKDVILNLVQETLSNIETTDTTLSNIIQKCIRIARLRQDFINLLWLKLESVNLNDKYGQASIITEVKPYFSNEEFSLYRNLFIEQYFIERPAIEFNDKFEIQHTDNIIGISVGEIEIELETWKIKFNNAVTPEGLHQLDTYVVDNQNFRLKMVALAYIERYQSILNRIRTRVYDFLSITEKRILFGEIYTEIFEKNRKYVESKLGELCPDALSKFVSAYQSINYNNPESWTYAITSCRRLLKDLADILYPPTNQPVVGFDGESRILSDALYKNRLWQFVFERVSQSKSSKLLLNDIQDIGNRIDRLYDLLNKGVHDEVDEFEFNQSVIQTYLLVGDILRIEENCGKP